MRTPEKERVYRRIKLRRILDSHGISGGLIVFHPARYANAKESVEKGVKMGFYFSPHYHVVGFIKGGYSRCRGCKYNNKYDRDRCRACEGFEGKVRRLNERDGFIVKVLGERKTIWGTVYYQLDHLGVTVENSGYHNVTWFGVVSYRALKLDEEDLKEVDADHSLCPLCQKSCRICVTSVLITSDSQKSSGLKSLKNRSSIRMEILFGRLKRSRLGGGDKV